MGINKTSEQTFESYIEETLLQRSGWQSGSNKEWDKKAAVFPEQIIDCIKISQQTLYGKMEKLHF